MESSHGRRYRHHAADADPLFLRAAHLYSGCRAHRTERVKRFSIMDKRYAHRVKEGKGSMSCISPTRTARHQSTERSRPEDAWPQAAETGIFNTRTAAGRRDGSFQLPALHKTALQRASLLLL